MHRTELIRSYNNMKNDIIKGISPEQKQILQVHTSAIISSVIICMKCIYLQYNWLLRRDEMNEEAFSFCAKTLRSTVDRSSDNANILPRIC